MTAPHETFGMNAGSAQERIGRGGLDLALGIVAGVGLLDAGFIAVDRLVGGSVVGMFRHQSSAAEHAPVAAAPVPALASRYMSSLSLGTSDMYRRALHG